MRVALLIAALVVALAAAATASAEHTGYWFYQGNIPTGDGVRTKLHGPHPGHTDIRVSWSACTHNMNAIKIRNNGTWESVTFNYAFGCDWVHHMDDSVGYGNFGCQNPAGLSTVWANCRVGNGV